jgi:hypothetical protein
MRDTDPPFTWHAAVDDAESEETGIAFIVYRIDAIMVG